MVTLVSLVAPRRLYYLLMYVDLEVLNFIERTKTKFKHAKIQISADVNLFFLFKEKKILVMAAILDRGLGCHTEF